MPPTHRRSAPGCLGLGLVLLLPVVLNARQDASPRATATQRIRPLGSAAVWALQHGKALSPTLRALVERLEQSDLIVYIGVERRPGHHRDGSIQFMHATAEFRLLRISVNIDLEPAQRIVLLGHELRHALEVAADPTVRDRESFLQFYAQFGTRHLDPTALDSQAAVETGERIERELAVADPRIRRD